VGITALGSSELRFGVTVSAARRLAAEQGLRRELPADAVVSLSGVNDVELQRLTEKLSRLQRSCGCRAGEIGTLLALMAVALCWLTAGWTSSPLVMLRAVGLSVAMVLVGGGLGKVAGLVFARLRYRAVVRRLTLRAHSGRTS
jgi:hypothetical protein